MIAFKAFEPGLICLGYQFRMGLNTTEKANCCSNGFHCAENPFDCLNYYRLDNAVFYVVNADGDIDEDAGDTKISCTELTVIRQLSRREFFLFGLAFMVDHPMRKRSSQVKSDRAIAYSGYAIVRGIKPIARGDKEGDILAFAQEDLSGNIVKIRYAEVDGKQVLPGVWYGIDLNKEPVGDLLQKGEK